MMPWNLKSKSIILATYMGCSLMAPQISASPKDKAPEEFVCPKNYKSPKKNNRSDVYNDTPFKQGESAKYELRYFGALAGYGTLSVKKPLKHNGLWHQVFNADASTGDWYKLVFVAHDTINAISHPWDFGIAKFYMKQDEGKLFSKRLVRKKWLDFDHKNCKVHEKTEQQGKEDKTATFDFVPSSLDTIGILYYMRTLKFEIGKKVQIPVYSSEKNWFMELDPLQFERIKTPAGEFDTVKMKVLAYIGDVLEQKGDVYIWMDYKSPDRKMVRAEGDIKIGTVKLELVEFKAGK